MNVNPKHKYNHRLEQYNQYSYHNKPNILHKFKGFNISRFSFAPFSVIVDVEVLCNKIKQTNLKGEAPFTLTFGSCWERKGKEIGKGIYLSFANWLVGAMPPTKQIKVGLASWDTTIISILETHLYFHFLASLAATSTTSFLLSIMSKSSGGNSIGNVYFMSSSLAWWIVRGQSRIHGQHSKWHYLLYHKVVNQQRKK